LLSAALAAPDKATGSNTTTTKFDFVIIDRFAKLNGELML
jgi:hypothetical protein